METAIADHPLATGGQERKCAACQIRLTFGIGNDTLIYCGRPKIGISDRHARTNHSVQRSECARATTDYLSSGTTGAQSTLNQDRRTALPKYSYRFVSFILTSSGFESWMSGDRTRTSDRDNRAIDGRYKDRNAMPKIPRAVRKPCSRGALLLQASSPPASHG